MRLIKGMGEAEADRIAGAVRARGAFASIESLWRASGARARTLRALAEGDAFGSMGLDRRGALWRVRPLKDAPMPLFEGVDTMVDDGVERLPETPMPERVLHDYASSGLSLKAHPVSFLREGLDGRGVVRAAELRDERASPSGRAVSVGGMVLCRQRPGTASGVVFLTIEDETGIANIVVWRNVFDRYRRVARLSNLLLVHGVVERQGDVIHVHARRLESLDDRMPSLAAIDRSFH